MSIRVRYTVQSAISSTSAEERDLGNVYWQIVTDQETKGGTTKTVVPAGTVGLQIQIDNVSTIQYLAIRTVSNNPNAPPCPVSLYLNSSLAVPILITPLGDAQEGHLLMSTDEVTAIYMSNTGPTDMSVTVGYAGI